MSEDPPMSVGSKGPSLPSFTERRRKNDPVMMPDKGFAKQLKALDEEFEVVWNWGQEFWEIWRFPKEEKKEPQHLISVTTKNKTYRELGADVLLKLQEGKHLAEMSLVKLVAYFDELDNQLQRRKFNDFRDKMQAIARYTYNLVAGVPVIQVPKGLKIGRAAHADS